MRVETVEAPATSAVARRAGARFMVSDDIAAARACPKSLGTKATGGVASPA